MDKLNDIVDCYNIVLKRSNESKDEIIKQLFILRKRALKLVENASKTLEKRSEELKIINETICEVQGHTYTDWEEHEGFLDRTWFYTRVCQLCGKKERMDDEPVEFRTQVLKRKK